MAGVWGQVVSQNLTQSYSNLATLEAASDAALTAAFPTEVRRLFLGNVCSDMIIDHEN